LKRNLPIGPAEKFREAVELGLRKEVTRLNFDIHRHGAWKVSPLTKIFDLVTGLVFVEVENNLVNVWGHTSVGGVERAETFTILPLHFGITIEVLLLEEGRSVHSEGHI
jgi:hypothetical protein